jgi:hypothetical protein
MTSGLICQPSAGHWTGGGASFGSPSGAPASAHFAIVSTSICESERSLANGPCAGSANHGGICRLSTLAFIDRAHGRVSRNVTSDIGAIWPGRWHDWQFFWRMGRTSLLKETGSSAADV